MPPVIPNPAAILEFRTQLAFEKWLAKNHATATEVWIKVHKKGSGLDSITCPQALDVALCYGWIDAIRKSLDETSFLQRYTPRTKKSIWSLVNTEHVARLIEAKRMQPAGHAQIEAAKADGRWEKAYGGAKVMTVPDDLLRAIKANRKAHAMYETLTSQNRYALSFRVVNLKTEAARARNIETFVKMLERGETFYPNGKASAARKVPPKKRN
ncbi:MAG: YdeI/OmpD-associated family protein [Gemmatimonas sp.]